MSIEIKQMIVKSNIIQTQSDNNNPSKGCEAQDKQQETFDDLHRQINKMLGQARER